MNVMDDLIYLVVFVSAFLVLIGVVALIYTALAKMFPNFERKLFEMFGIDIDELEDDDEDDDEYECGCKIIRFDAAEGERYGR